ncbi:MAG: DUF1189 family protein [Bacilli bacterium]|nr:DUF1189 family protein [Bacilli bacterium]MBN2876612.1 DUF1189 family protein [Bacilli bacterium]
MFQILHDSIFNPKGLVKHVTRSGWFVFFYIVIMMLFMTIGAFVYYLGYDNSVVTEDTTGCRVSNGALVCDGTNYDPNNIFDLYGIRVYFLADDASVNDISEMSEVAMVFQGDSVSVYRASTLFISEPIFGITNGSFISFDETVALFGTMFLVIGILSNAFANLALLMVVILISGLMFHRYRYDIVYSKRFKLATYAVTPLVLLITFFNILNFDQLIFFVLAFFAYRPLFVLNRELYMQLMLRKVESVHQESEEEDVIESYPYPEEEEKSDDDSDSED